MSAARSQVPPGYRAVPLLAWSAVLLSVALPVAAAFVLAAYPHSVTELCAARRALNIPGAPALYPLPPLAVGLVWPGVAAALIVLTAGVVRYGRSVMDSTRTLGWGAVGLLGLVLLVGNGIMVYVVYHGGLGMVVVCG
ncbi:MAG TPA: hypothetical protein VJ914_22715 [Pseudonocardiaceae bacterium]|nr:hypothetical protein [Pseudonocardiaceae bacterium]